MSRGARRLLAVLLLLPPLVVAGLAAWLGPGDVWWSARALVRPPHPGAAWAHADPSAPMVVAADPGRLLAAPVMVALRPQLDAIATTQGLDLDLAESGIGRTVTVLDGRGRGYTVATGMALSPSLLPRLAPGWHRLVPPGGTAAGVTDGQVFLAPLAPGIVLAAPPELAAESLRRAAPLGSAEPRLTLDGDVMVRAEVIPDATLRAELARRLPAEARYLADQLARAEARMSAATDLRLDVDLEHRSEDGARRSEALLAQVEAAGRMARQVGALGQLLLKGDAAMLLDVPETTVRREGTVVRVGMTLTEEQARRWLERLLAHPLLGQPPGGVPGVAPAR